MDWMREYEALPERDRDAFTRLISVLFEQTFLVRDIWDTKDARLTGNRDYRFAERVRPLLDAYLRVSGWALQVDTQLGVMAVYNRFGRNRQPLDKLTTYFLYTLRLMYEEAMEQVSGRREILISLRDALDKLAALNVVEKKLAVTALQATLQRLRRLSVIERVDGELLSPESRYIIYPTIRILVSEERIHQLVQSLDAGEFEDAGGENDGTAGEGLFDESEIDDFDEGVYEEVEE